MSVQTLDRLVRQVTAQVRWRRAEHYGVRGAFYGALAAVGLLIFKQSLGPAAMPAALALLIVGALAGAAVGLAKRVPARDAARLADRAFGLDDRVATALEWAGREDRSPLVDALVADATERASNLTPRQIVRRRASREARLLALPVAVGVLLALAPAVPVPSLRLPDFSAARDEDKAPDRGEGAAMQETSRNPPKDALKRPAMDERDFVQRAGTGGSATTGTSPPCSGTRRSAMPVRTSTASSRRATSASRC